MLVRRLLSDRRGGAGGRFRMLVERIGARSSPSEQAAAVAAAAGIPIGQLEAELVDWHRRTRWGIGAPTRRNVTGIRVDRSGRLPLESATLDPVEVRQLCRALKGLGAAPPLPEPRYYRCYEGYLTADGAADAGAPPPTDSSRDPQELQQLVHGRADTIKECLAAALPYRPELAGRIVVQFTIAADGSVSRSAIASSTAGAPEVEACIGRTICQWRFPAKGSGPVVVTYPFTLRQRGKGP